VPGVLVLAGIAITAKLASVERLRAAGPQRLRGVDLRSHRPGERHQLRDIARHGTTEHTLSD
jgi:hypothetical protein